MPVRIEECLCALEVLDASRYADGLHRALQLHRIGERFPVALVVGHILEILIPHIVSQLATSNRDSLQSLGKRR